MTLATQLHSIVILGSGIVVGCSDAGGRVMFEFAMHILNTTGYRYPR
jgi:hypothetical protein